MSDWISLVRTGGGRVHVPVDKVELIEPRPSGEGCLVYTAHQIVTVVESDDEVMKLIGVRRP